jgi:hypothetical protein
MSAVETVVSGKFSTFERVLLIFASVFLLSDEVAAYVSTHTDRSLEATILSLLPIPVGGVFAIIAGLRIVILIALCRFRQRWLASSALLACAGLLMVFPFMGATAAFHAFDQLRFHMNSGFYAIEVEKSDTSPKFVVFDWGGVEFAPGYCAKYFLVFDENNSIARGLADPMDMPLPNERTKCNTSVLPLSGSFYSVTVDCELT